MYAKGRPTEPAMPQPDQQRGVAFPDVVPNSPSSRTGQSEWSIEDVQTTGSRVVPKPHNSSPEETDWSIDTDVGSSSRSGVELQLERARPHNNGNQTTNGDWSIDTDVGDK